LRETFSEEMRNEISSSKGDRNRGAVPVVKKPRNAPTIDISPDRKSRRELH
jgi:hypothetical protein